MDRKILILLISGIILTVIAFLVNTYAAGIVFIIFVALLMSLFIMQDSITLPDVVAEIREDAKAIIIRNSGNSDALKVHVALVPMDMEFTISVLAPDQVNEYPLDKMIQNVKAFITFESVVGEAFSRTYTLSADGREYDPLKPMLPLFRQK